MAILKEKYHSAYDDFRTGFFCKLSLFLGFALLIVYAFLRISSLLINQNDTSFLRLIYDVSKSGYIDSLMAFSILLIGVGFILYFLHYQFAKLAKIADEIESKIEDEEPDQN
jgi:TRAP-type C4-dicarboxylate transport system permease small subunit